MSTRRRFLAALGLSTAALAGCAEPPTPETDDDDPGQAGGTPSPDHGTVRVGGGAETPTETAAAAESTSDGTTDGTAADGDRNGTATEGTRTATATPGTRSELDLREANVVGVAVEAVGDRTYRFDVTLVRGGDGRADRWIVEDANGTELGRRELAPARGTREFTRSETVSVPEGTACVVVRGHDRTHGYGGSAVLASVDSGETALVRQGPGRIPSAELTASCP